MLYLFNSAYRPKYRRNILDVLFMQTGMINEFRYSNQGKRRNVSTDLPTELDTLPRRTDAVVIYVERKEDGYRYYPLRRGTFLTHRSDAGYLYIDLVLSDYIYPINVESFTGQLLDALPNLPRLTTTVDNPNDGYYAIRSDTNLFADPSAFKSGDDAWIDIVDALSGTTPFKSTPSEEIIFVKGALVEDGPKQRMVQPTIKHTTALFQLNPTRTYLLRLSYRFPAQLTNKDTTGHVTVELDDTLRTFDEIQVPIDTYANSVTIGFRTKKHSKELDGHIRLSWASSATAKALLGPPGNIRTRIHDGTRFHLQVSILIVLAAICSVLVGGDLTDKASGELLTSLIITEIMIKAIAAIVGGFSLLCIVRLLGERVP